MAKKLRKVEVTWEDALSSGGWHDLDVHASVADALAHSIGYLVRKDAKHVIIVQSSMAINGNASASLQIPMGIVKKIRYLKG